MLKNKKILVTGGAGFIGSNLIEALLEQENRVVCLDNFSTGKRENIESFLRHPDFHLIEGDIRNPETCRCAVKQIDLVFHEAALGSVPRSVKDPITSSEVNITGFINMLTAAKDADVSKFIYAASSSVYGDNPALPKREGETGRPLSPYALTKLVNEWTADVFHRIYGINCIGLRYFNVFGRRQDPNGAYAAVIPRFIHSLLNHESPVIHGDGTFSRDFTYIDNVLKANMLAAETDLPEAWNTVYNIACGTETDLNTLFRLLRTYLSEYDSSVADVNVIHGSPRLGDIPHSLADISKAETKLDYHPEYSFEEGLRRTSAWYAEHH